MTKPLTKDALGIFWDGEEQPGITVYGLWEASDASEPAFPARIWPDDTMRKSAKLSGDSWTVWLWDIRIHTWPSTEAWSDVVMTTLAEMRSAGAVVSWCGLEGYFADPPRLFDPQEMSGGIWAVLGPDDIAVRPPGLNAPFEVISDVVMLNIRKHLLIS